jgi:beta-phosphoglucomutase
VGIKSLFDVVIDGAKVKQDKPNPEVFLSAARELNIPPTSCIVFEDAEAGIEAALRAGMGAVGIGRPIALKDADMVMAGLYQLVVLTVT